MWENNSKTSEVLSKYFTITENTATVRLNFDTFSELIDQNLGDDSVEHLNSTLYEKLTETFALIPRKYKIEIEIYICDFGDYSIEEAEKIIKENIQLTIHALWLERRRKNKTGLSLLAVGIIMLSASYFLNRLPISQIFFDIMNISGTLFVWEAADVALIERGEEAKRARQYISKLKNIHLLKA